MRVRNLVTGEKVEASLSTEHPASRQGRPVLVVDGVAYGVGDTTVLALVEATGEERETLRSAGYDLERDLTDAEAAEKWRLMQAEALLRWRAKHKGDLNSASALEDYERMTRSGKIDPNWDSGPHSNRSE